jgi:serine/threonine-protein kinase
VLEGRYRLDAQLGAGGMGSVYRGVHLLMEKPVAIKVLREELAEDDLAAKRFQREAKNASRLDHPHCLRVTDFGVTDDNVRYLVMELVPGETLGEILDERGSLPPGRAALIAAQVAQALAHAHGLGLVHRDLKPDNVLVDTAGGRDFVKVLDFGLAKLLDPENPERRTQLTAHGVVFGTPEYMSPEQATGREVDHRADLYALGVLLYHMVTGLLPFQAPSVIDILNQQVRKAPSPPTERAPDVWLPPGMEALIMGLLAKSPDERPQSAQDVGESLARLAQLAGGAKGRSRVPAEIAARPTVDVATAKPPSAPRRNLETEPEVALARSSRRVRVFAAVTICALAVAVGFLLAGGRGERRPRASDLGPQVPEPERKPAVAPAPIPAPTSPAEPHVAEAAKFAQSGNRLKELFHLQEALKADPGHKAARLRLATVLLDDGQPDLACRTLAPIRDDPSAAPLATRAACGK